MNPDCMACQRLRLMETRGVEANPFFVAELQETIAVLHDHQGFEGWTVLLLKDHVEHLAELSLARQAAIFHDVARVANAVRSVLSPRRINYECLGNVMAHVHWHVIPRYAAPVDPDPKRPVWVFGAEYLECGSDAGRVTALAARIRAALR